jgi:uncharacterized membrane protein YdjX (TVP38/TMEM64 family)
VRSLLDRLKKTLFSAPAMPRPAPRRSPWRSASVYSVGLAFVLAGITLGWIDAIGGLDALQLQFGAWAPLLIAPAHLLVTITPIGEFVPWGWANGALFGTATGALLNGCVWISASLVHYGLGRRMALDFNLDRRAEKLPTWLQRFPADHPIFLICGRWFPMGSLLVNTAAGTARVPFRRFAVCVVIGTVPQALLVAGGGAQLVRLLQWFVG